MSSTVTIPDSIDVHSIAFAFKNHIGTSILSDERMYAVIPEIQYIVSVAPGDAQVVIVLHQKHSGAYAEYQVKDGSGTLLTVSSASASGQDVTITVTGLTNKTSYDLFVKAINSDGYSCDWFTDTRPHYLFLNDVIPSKLPVAPRINSVRRDQINNVATVTFENLDDQPNCSQPSVLTVYYTYNDGTAPATVRLPIHWDSSGNIAIDEFTTTFSNERTDLILNNGNTELFLEQLPGILDGSNDFPHHNVFDPRGWLITDGTNWVATITAYEVRGTPYDNTPALRIEVDHAFPGGLDATFTIKYPAA